MRIVRKGGLDGERDEQQEDRRASSPTSISGPFRQGVRLRPPRLLHPYPRYQFDTRARTFASTSPRAARTSVSRSTASGPPWRQQVHDALGSIPMDLFCMKSDYSDSSMTLNTGVAKLYNDVMLELGLLTPPQRYQLEQAGGDLNAVKVEQSIDGFPSTCSARRPPTGRAPTTGSTTSTTRRARAAGCSASTSSLYFVQSSAAFGTVTYC